MTIARNILAEIESACKQAEFAGTDVILSHKDLRWLLENRRDGWTEAAKQLDKVDTLRRDLAHEHSMRGWYK